MSAALQQALQHRPTPSCFSQYVIKTWGGLGRSCFAYHPQDAVALQLAQLKVCGVTGRQRGCAESQIPGRSVLLPRGPETTPSRVPPIAGRDPVPEGSGNAAGQVGDALLHGMHAHACASVGVLMHDSLQPSHRVLVILHFHCCLHPSGNARLQQGFAHESTGPAATLLQSAGVKLRCMFYHTC